MAFECPHCGFRNNELQSAGVVNERGHTISLAIQSKDVSSIVNKVSQACLIDKIILGYESSIS